MSAYKPYPKTKPSGVEWLGDVPEGWEVVPLFADFRRIKQTNFADLELLSVYRDYGVIPKSSRDDNFNKESDDLSSYQRVQKGDLVLNKMKAWQGSIGVSNHEGIVSPAYFTYRPNPGSKRFDPVYLHHLVRSLEYTAYYLSRSKGIRVNQWDLDPDEFRSTPLLCPPLPEQIQIASFLDRECGKLDALQAKQERLIELLKEKRQALISHTVTKGLDPNAKLKPSGIEWLGDVPEHWHRTRIGWVASVGNGSTPHRDEPGYWTEGDFPWLNSGTVNNPEITESDQFVTARALHECHLPIVTPDSLVMAITGEGKTRGTVSIVRIKCTLSQHVAYIRIYSRKICPDYIMAFLRSKYERIRDESEGWGSTKAAITCSDIYRYNLPLPPLAEQRAIVAHLDDKCGRMDALIAKAERAIALLKERRSALISAAVTGKIDVREN